MNKTFLPFLRQGFRFLLFLLLTGSVCACSSDDGNGDKKGGNTKIRRTAIIYMAADNSLGYEKYAQADSAEISNGSVFLNERDQIILYYDNGADTRIYRFYKGQKVPQIVKKYDRNLCSSAPSTLKDVLSWIRTTYPSESYGLTLWSHGDGWIPSFSHNYSQKALKSRSFGVDCGPGGNRSYDLDASGFYGAAMDMDSLAWAIEQSGIHMNYLFFDACLMQCLESDYELRNVTDYIVASPISTAAIGANYTGIVRNGLFSDNPDDIAQNIYLYMQDLPYQYKIYRNYGVVYSTIKTSELKALAELTSRMLPGNITDGKEVDMSGVQRYSEYTADYLYRPEYYDAACAMKKILPEADFALWKAQLERCIVGKYSTEKFYLDTDESGQEIYLSVDRQNYCALSMFVPQKRYSANAYHCIYGDLNKAFKKTAWYKDSGWDATGW